MEIRTNSKYIVFPMKYANLRPVYTPTFAAKVLNRHELQLISLVTAAPA